MSILTCHECNAVADPDQRFCGECGTPLATGCPNCGASNPPGRRFCGNCGMRIDGGAAPTTGPGAQGSAAGIAPSTATSSGPRSAQELPSGTGAAPVESGSPVAERRLVSVLFADLVGFTPFAEERDSEDVRETLTRYFDLATEIITRYGGTVEKFIGDAVMAVWGTPTTREDDAERAVRAALDLVAAVTDLGPGIQARAGVLTGETAVTLGAQNQGMVAGDLVNTAARLQSVATPGTVLVGESTYRAASVAIAFEPAGEQALKGKAAPVQAWRAMRVVAERGGRGRADAIEPPFVGRDMELRLLKDLFHAVGAERRIRHVSIVGTAGIGKSRLGWEFEKYLDGIDETVLWHHGRSPAYGTGITFWSLGEMIRSRAQLRETDDHAATRERITAMVDDVMPGYPNRDWVERAMLQLLGVEGGVSSGELFGAWRAFFEALSRRGTVVLVFQDVHWADQGTLDFIDHLVEWSREFPIYIVSLARPELLDERPDWGTVRRSFTTMYLEPISPTAMREMLAGMIPNLPETTTSTIVKQAEGVPLYAVEIVRMLITSGEIEAAEDGTFTITGDVTDLAVPETLTALIGARLDALEPADRALILDAAVLGTSFTPAGLAAVTGREITEIEPRLRALARRELLRHVADDRSPELGQYAFVQALVRETAYNTLSKRDRQSRHLAAARWFETLGEPELVGALAGHFLAARSLAPKGAEADALAAQARLALKAAGDRAASLGSYRQAAEFYAQALSVTVDEGDEAEICELAAEVAQTMTEFDAAIELLTRAVEIHRGRNDRAASARLAATLGTVMLNARRYDDAERVLTDAITDFADLGDDPSVLRMKSQLARRLMLINDYAPVLPLTDEVLSAAEHTDDLDLLTDTLVTRGTALNGLLRWREGTAVLETALDIAKAEGLNSTWLRAINNIMQVKLGLDPRGTMEIVRGGLALAQRLGHDAWVHGLSSQLSLVAWRTGGWEGAIADLEAGLQTTSDARTRLNAVDNLATVRAFRGESIEAEAGEIRATSGLDPDAPISRIMLLDVAALEHFAAGRIREAFQAWAAIEEIDVMTAVLGGIVMPRLATWTNDPDETQRWADLYWQFNPHGGAAEADYHVAIANARGLRGERAAAIAGYREALQRYRELRLDLDIAYMAVDMAWVVGADEPLAAELIPAARATFAAEKARPALDQLDLAIAQGPYGRESTPARATSAKGSAVRTP